MKIVKVQCRACSQWFEQPDKHRLRTWCSPQCKTKAAKLAKLGHEQPVKFADLEPGPDEWLGLQHQYHNPILDTDEDSESR